MRLFWSTLYLIGFFIGFCTVHAINKNGNVNYRLNTDIEPIHYIVDVTPHLQDGKEPFSFDGICTITLKTGKSNVSAITLHKFGLDITKQSLTTKPSQTEENRWKIENITIKSSEYDETTHKYTLKLASPLIKDQLYTLYLKYSGKFGVIGFMPNSYQEGNVSKWYAATQFQPTYARNVFPCFDEPRFKATFSVIVNRPAHFKPSLSNMPMISSHHTSANLVREYFQKTPKMSTYLVAIVVSEFECRENALKNFAVCAPPMKYNQTEYGLNFGRKILETLGELFDYNYFKHMPKLTLAAAYPIGGGMENWGLIFVAGQSVFYDPKSHPLSIKKNIASVITHEIAHLWFGDLVTCEWWSDIWLNEGFATYFQWFGLAMVEKDWGLDQKFLTTILQDIMGDDSGLTTKPIIPKVETPDDITFGLTVYNKGASIARMISHTLGNDKFIDGLRIYFKQNALKAAVTDKLFDAFQTAAGNKFNVSKVFNGWVYQPGHPVISVQMSSDRKQINVRQNRFLYNNTVHHDKTLWNVPLNWASSIENSDFSYSKPMAMLTNSSMKIELSEPVDWIIFNVQHAGFYRVNYDDKTWSAIADILHKSHSKIHVMNRAQLINDVFALTRYSYTGYENAIKILDYLQYEIKYAPWYAAFNYINFISGQFHADEVAIFEKFGLKLSNRMYKYLGFYQTPNHTHLDMEIRENVVKFACSIGNEQCIADARKEFALYQKGNHIIPDYLESVVFCSVIAHGSEKEWNFIWKLVEAAGQRDDRWLNSTYINMFSALDCTKQEGILRKFFNLILANDSSSLSMALDSKTNIKAVMDFVFDKHKEIKAAGESVEDILISIISNISTHEELKRIQRFIEQNGMDSNQEIIKKMKAAMSSIKWTEKYGVIIKKSIKRIIKRND